MAMPSIRRLLIFVGLFLLLDLSEVAVVSRSLKECPAKQHDTLSPREAFGRGGHDPDGQPTLQMR